MRTARVAFQLLFFVLPLAAQAQQRGIALPPKTAATGSYYAFIVGIDAYQNEPHLMTAVADAKAVDAVLRQRYGFQTKILLDTQATRTNILRTLGDYRRTLNEGDSLLVYYAGHGIRDGGKAYWLPVDADRDCTANCIIADEVTKSISVIPAKHILVISDSCYSGGLTRDAGVTVLPAEHNAAMTKLLESKSRVLISSGRDEPVADGGGSGHSIFAGALINQLAKTTEASFSAESLYSAMKEPVVGNSSQVPQYNMIQGSGHEGGDFVFFTKTGASVGVPVAELRPSVPVRPAPVAPAPAPKIAPTPLPSTPAIVETKPARGNDPVTGCWQYNSILSLIFYNDGRVTGFLDGGHWSQTSPGQYTIRWPQSIDTVTLLPGGRSVKADNNYFGVNANSAQRVSNESAGFVGSWHWTNGGLTSVVSPNGEVHIGGLGGRWTQTGANTFREVWDLFFLDTVTLSADGRQLTGHNNLNVPVGGVRIACAN